jgi:regulator of RNase E activity RraA/2-keto-4-pentenoate hydratase/2-oxohepta-3-ene-1,7-dioic acid hydratase in catechol pathway
VVRLGYVSGAEERGVRPERPSYFLKPSSSVGFSGGVVERPVGSRRLTFGGAIALIVGESARHVPLDQAWDRIAWVTAANDLGVDDLQAVDEGSDLRAKGGDGFTPIGPALIDARTVDPSALRVRTWVNGRLAQEDTVAGMLFPPAHIVADLSEHLTLETGDVIITGTPAGSSVIVPGDSVEVEVDAADAADPPTTGRLTTTVVEGKTASSSTFGSLPALDDTRRAKAWSTREAAGLPATVGAPTLPAALRDKLMRAPVAGLSAQLRKRGLDNVTVDGVRPLGPVTKMVGTARTVRFVPNREDLFSRYGGGYNAQKRAFDVVGAGEVLVIDARGDGGAGTLGDILALRAHARQAAGIVTDGGVRDAEAVAAIGIPVYSAGPHPAVLGRRHVPWEADVTVGCGGTTVQPGDVVVGDADGVIVLPPALAEEVADAVLEQEEEDGWIAQQVAAGHPVDGLFPLNAEWRAKYEAWRAAP